jgi:hypothetical protein
MLSHFSPILFAETLPMVSLLWLVSIVCVFLMPGLPNPSQAAQRSSERDLGMVTPKISSENPETLDLILHGRFGKGTRVKFKLQNTLPFKAVAAC